MAQVLISDKMSKLAEEIFAKNNISYDVKTDLSEEELIKIIGNYEGLAIRSSTKVTEKIINAAKNLKVIGRAGIGVDNVDLKASTNKGIIVMNTPFGNSTTTAEHAIAMMMSLARQIPQANSSTHSGKWEKSKFMGTELTGKTLAVIGCGNIGSIVASRGIGLKMKVIAYDPFLSHKKAEEIGVEKVELDDALARGDFITLHTPLNDATKHIIGKDNIAKMKKGVFIINCARGELVNEVALKEALENGKVKGAALDVFAVEPAKENILFGMENVIATPHLGASTNEAQENVALEIAQQISDFLNKNIITNSVNIASVSAEDAIKMKPFLALAKQLGGFAGQLTENPVENINIEYQGNVASLDTRFITANIVAEFLSPFVDNVNVVNALSIAKEKGIDIKEIKSDKAQNFSNLIRFSIKTEVRERSIAGTLFDNNPKIVEINNISLEANIAPVMIYIRNADKPGFIGDLGRLLGDNNINIANFNLGRAGKDTGSAIALIDVDGADISDELLKKLKNLPNVAQVKLVRF